MNDFDPYHEWLGIPPDEQPPNHYRLLGIPVFEPSEKVISNAADRQMLFVRQFQTGEHVVESQRLLNEIAGAKVCLLNAATKSAYDEKMQDDFVPPLSPSTSPENALDLFDVSSAVDFKLNQQLPATDSVTLAPHTQQGLSSRRPLSIRIIGHILAPLIGLSLGWFILHWMRSDRSAPAAASQSIKSPLNPKSHAVPLEQAAVTPDPNPFDLERDPTARDSTAQQEPANKAVEKLSPPTETPQPVQASAEKYVTTRNKAIAKGDVAAALVATDQLTRIGEQDVIQAKFEFLREIQTNEAFELREVVIQMLILLDAAIEGNHEKAAEIAALTLASARQTNDPALIRKATLGVLETQRLASESKGE